MRYAESFKRSFISAYTECHGCFADEARRQEYHVNWDHFMLCNPEPPLEKPVLTLTAEKMDLLHSAREPFRLDGAFVAQNFRNVGSYQIPMIVVFEHEDKIAGFSNEVVKLAHIRCPLKVGITYSPIAEHKSSEGLILKCVSDIFRELNEYTMEDPESEYVYLLGVEERLFEVAWYHLTFDAASGPGAFEALGHQT